jgi:hypothetical protein
MNNPFNAVFVCAQDLLFLFKTTEVEQLAGVGVCAIILWPFTHILILAAVEKLSKI